MDKDQGLPEPGFPAVCLYCGALNAVAGNLTIIRPTAELLADWQRDRKLWRQITALQAKFRDATAAAVFGRPKKGKPQ